MAFNPVGPAQIEMAAEGLLAAANALAAAAQTMRQEEMPELWLPWSALTDRAIEHVLQLGGAAAAEIQPQLFALKRGVPNARQRTRQRTSRDYSQKVEKQPQKKAAKKKKGGEG